MECPQGLPEVTQGGCDAEGSALAQHPCGQKPGVTVVQVWWPHGQSVQHLLCLHGELWHLSGPLGTAAMPPAMPGWQVMPGSQGMPRWRRAPGAAVPLEQPGARKEAARAEGQCPCSCL